MSSALKRYFYSVSYLKTKKNISFTINRRSQVLYLFSPPEIWRVKSEESADLLAFYSPSSSPFSRRFPAPPTGAWGSSRHTQLSQSNSAILIKTICRKRDFLGLVRSPSHSLRSWWWRSLTRRRRRITRTTPTSTTTSTMTTTGTPFSTGKQGA